MFTVDNSKKEDNSNYSSKTIQITQVRQFKLLKIK